MQIGRNNAGSEADSLDSRPSPPQMKGRLPHHFAAMFQYPGESVGASSRVTLPETSFPQITPRNRPRARKTKFANLSTASPSDQDVVEDHLGRSAPSPSKKSRAKVATIDVSKGVEMPSSTTKANRKSRKRIRRTRDNPNSASGSIYAHLKGLPDLFKEYNDIMFCGINPGVKSSSSGHHFAHRSNHFYPSLHLAGITEHRMKPEQDVDFPFLRPFSLGLTNLAGRPTAEGNELLPSELIAGVPILLEKVQRWKPRIVCFVGKGISESFMKGLKQAGAIHNSSSGRQKRAAISIIACEQNLNQEPGVKIEESEPSRSALAQKAEGVERPARSFVKATIASDILCAYPPPGTQSEDTKLRNGALPFNAPPSPSKGRKRLYTKGNSKDDTGYGMLPICVAHSKEHGNALGLVDVTLFFVTPSSSARVTTHFLDDKVRILSSLRLLAEHLQSASSTLHAVSNDTSNGRTSVGSHRESIKTEAAAYLENQVLSRQPIEGVTKTVELEVVDPAQFALKSVESATSVTF